MKCETLFPCNEWAARIVFERFHYGNRRFIFSNNDNRKKQSLIWHMSIIKKDIGINMRTRSASARNWNQKMEPP